MIEGMPASSSMAMPIGRRSHCGQSSVRKIAMPRPTGIAIDHRDHRGHQRAVDRTERAEHRRIGRRRPPRRRQEREAELLDRRPGARDQGENDAAEDQQHRNRAGAGDPVEGDVAELEGVERPGAIVRSGGFHHIALNGHVCHANPLLYYSNRASRDSDTSLDPDCAARSAGSRGRVAGAAGLWRRPTRTSTRLGRRRARSGSATRDRFISS